LEREKSLRRPASLASFQVPRAAMHIREALTRPLAKPCECGPCSSQNRLTSHSGCRSVIHREFRCHSADSSCATPRCKGTTPPMSEGIVRTLKSKDRRGGLLPEYASLSENPTKRQGKLHVCTGCAIVRFFFAYPPQHVTIGRNQENPCRRNAKVPRAVTRNPQRTR
jgi:hypothetical protein